MESEGRRSSEKVEWESRVRKWIKIYSSFVTKKENKTETTNSVSWFGICLIASNFWKTKQTCQTIFFFHFFKKFGKKTKKEKQQECQTSSKLVNLISFWLYYASNSHYCISLSTKRTTAGFSLSRKENASEYFYNFLSLKTPKNNLSNFFMV